MTTWIGCPVEARDNSFIAALNVAAWAVLPPVIHQAPDDTADWVKISSQLGGSTAAVQDGAQSRLGKDPPAFKDAGGPSLPTSVAIMCLLNVWIILVTQKLCCKLLADRGSGVPPAAAGSTAASSTPEEFLRGLLQRTSPEWDMLRTFETHIGSAGRRSVRCAGQNQAAAH